MRPSASGLLWGVILVLIAASPFVLLAVLGPSDAPAEVMPRMALNELAQEIRGGRITSIEISGGSGFARDVFGYTYIVQLGQATDPLHTLSAFGVTPEDMAHINYVVHDSPSFDGMWTVIASLLPSLILGLWLLMILRSGAGVDNQLLNLGRARARRFVAGPNRVRFLDVAGVEDAKAELQELVEFLAHPDRFATLGARIPRGVLLVGPTGTGKTLLARAVAGEASVPFFSISGSEFVEILVGLGASRVRDFFRQAAKSAPSIVFIDEIDAIGRQRGAGLGSGNDEREQTLNQILVEMDGFDSSTNVVVIAATNRPDVLDPALLRAGRFDRQILVPPPGLTGREAILQVHARGRPFDRHVNLSVLARATCGLSGADLANVINESAILAARHDKRCIGMPELEEAVERVISGPAYRSRVISPEDRQRTAYHASGHALAVRYLEHHDPLHKVSIVAHGTLHGTCRAFPPEDRSVVNRSQLKAMLTAALGGLAAEHLVLGEAASGSETDIRMATDIARSMVSEYGMSDRLGPVALGSADGLMFLGSDDGDATNYSGATAETIDREIRCLIDEGYARAIAIVTEHREILDRMALALIRFETLEGPALERIFTAPSTPS